MDVENIDTLQGLIGIPENHILQKYTTACQPVNQGDWSINWLEQKWVPAKGCCTKHSNSGSQEPIPYYFPTCQHVQSWTEDAANCLYMDEVASTLIHLNTTQHHPQLYLLEVNQVHYCLVSRQT